MQDKIHPAYVSSVITCSCGTKFVTKSTRPKIQVEICSQCHPFYTGKRKLMDDAGRVERFAKMMAKTQAIKKQKKLRQTKRKTAKK